MVKLHVRMGTVDQTGTSAPALGVSGTPGGYAGAGQQTKEAGNWPPAYENSSVGNPVGSNYWNQYVPARSIGNVGENHQTVNVFMICNWWFVVVALGLTIGALSFNVLVHFI